MQQRISSSSTRQRQDIEARALSRRRSKKAGGRHARICTAEGHDERFEL
jgi:hypothetical protein